MKNYVLVFTLLAVMTFQSRQAEAIELCAKSRDSIGEKIQRMVEALLATSFSEIRGFRIRICHKRTDGTSFFSAKPDPATLIYGPRGRLYEVFFHPRIFELGVSDSAIKAVLAHELVHVSTYTRMSSTQIVSLGIAYEVADRSGDYRWVNCFERQTDYHAARRGYAQGLADYSRWVLNRLKGRDRVKKARMYLSERELFLAARGVPFLHISPQCR